MYNMHLVETRSVCVSAYVCLYVYICLHDDKKTIADICILFGSYVDWRKISDEFACQDHRQGQGHFWRVQGHSVRLRAVLSWTVRFHLRYRHFL